MISNLSLAVKLHSKSSPEDATEEKKVLVEYSKEEDASTVASGDLQIQGLRVLMYLESIGKPAPKEEQSEHSNHKYKVFLGNLSLGVTEESLSELVKKVHSKGVIVKTSAKSEKKYAFLEFETESQRNIALGQIEVIKQEGALSTEVEVSVAHPYTPKRSRYGPHRKGRQKTQKPSQNSV
ncbi:uncharacterized protein NESG_00769 [Nematocida ausubeli]|uniref:RRM domain-containing protein n=1 Tax=Nematocida ausubeli (strain ATCC PRA-371 / ERTm2) TaxID=1913371 RepID=A0A086J3A0_NEMA1|nr:uncharacterized protein NESG_00769 [Nematocida ausubeli]KAI5150317.1 hypothetical protein NEAUS05_2122 [Nematocida ausubeli]KFG26618.1 hypothetical protein NESG_00769 [Nematocida ausubeli]